MTSERVIGILAKYRHLADTGQFMDSRIQDMSREELLGLVGWMSQDKKSSLEMLRETQGFRR